jgi:hypothetical protein
MFKWLQKKAHSSFVGVQEREMRAWINNLAALDSSEVAGILVMAMHFRNTLLGNGGPDLLFPFVAIKNDPMIAIKLNKQLQELQNENLFSVASGAIVWLFTIRAAFEPELRDLGRQLWTQLERGFPSANDAVIGFHELTGVTLDVIDIGCFPDGFTPVPL